MKFFMQNGFAPGGARCIEFGATVNGRDLELGRLVGGHMSANGSELRRPELQALLESDGDDDAKFWRNVGVALGKIFGMRCPCPCVEANALDLWEAGSFVEGYEAARRYMRKRGIGPVL